MKPLFKTGITSLLAVFVAVTTLGVGTAYSATAAKKSPAKPAPKTPVVKPAPKAPVAPAQINWETKTTDKATFDIPSTWKQDEYAPPSMVTWSHGASSTAADGGFVLIWESMSPEEVLKSGEAKKVGPVDVSGIVSTEYAVVAKAMNFEGIAVIADKPEADGRRMIIIAGSNTGKWRQHESTLRKIIASIKIKGAPAKTK